MLNGHNGSICGRIRRRLIFSLALAGCTAVFSYTCTNQTPREEKLQFTAINRDLYAESTDKISGGNTVPADVAIQPIPAQNASLETHHLCLKGG